MVGAERYPVVGYEAFLGLHEVQQRQQGRAALGVAADDLGRHWGKAGARLIAERHYLSTPPITGSMLATAAMTSATMPPSHITDTACRFVNDGSRKCTRYGLVPPSLTAWQPSSPRGDSTAAYTCPAGTRKPSVTSLKWWMRASIDWPMMWAMWAGEFPRPSVPTPSCAGQPILGSDTITRSLGRLAASRSTHC